MRPINVSLDSQTWEEAKKIPNFSQWIRTKLRERMAPAQPAATKCVNCGCKGGVIRRGFDNILLCRDQLCYCHQEEEE